MSATHIEIEEFEAQKHDAQEAYVRRFGWSVTCNTPGAYWLWQRDFAAEDAERHKLWKDAGRGPYGWPSEPKPYGRITATLEIAVAMTRRTLDRDEEALELSSVDC